MLEVQGLVKIFYRNTPNERYALNGVDLRIEEGDFVTVIGSNGAGKSTLLNAIAGVFPVDGGRILLDGREVGHLPEDQRAAYIGRVFQDPLAGTSPSLSIEENLALAEARGRRRGLRRAVDARKRQAYRERLAAIGLELEERLHTRVGLLSGGERQALTLVMAVMQKPRLLLLDEHTAALDPKRARLIVELTRRLVAEEGLTTLMVTHNMEQALRLGNRLIMMHRGRVVIDIRGEQKRRMGIPDLLAAFETQQGEHFSEDRMILGQ